MFDRSSTGANAIVVALTAAPHTALVVLIVCVAGALGTLAAGSWQSARFALRREASSFKPLRRTGVMRAWPGRWQLEGRVVHVQEGCA